MEHPLRTYRIQHKLTQVELADLLGVSDATITHIETGKRRITPENAIDWEPKIGISRDLLCPGVFGRQQRSTDRPRKRATDKPVAHGVVAKRIG